MMDQFLPYSKSHSISLPLNFDFPVREFVLLDIDGYNSAYIFIFLYDFVQSEL